MAHASVQRSAVEKSKTRKPARRVAKRVSREDIDRPQPKPIETSEVNKVTAELNWLVMQEARRIARRLPYHAELDELIG
ncbi:MAG: hypothetical protein AAFQ82_27040, partial [Myxococcota bacterium]